jgi:hypothetical protein
VVETSVADLLSREQHSEQHRVVEILTEFTVRQGEYASDAWRDLFYTLLVSFRDGFSITGLNEPSVTLTNSELDARTYVDHTYTQ